MSQKLLNFKTHQLFYSYVNAYLPEFDIKASASKGRFTFIYDGNIYAYRNLYIFLGKLNGLLGEKLFCIKHSRITSRTRYKIFVDSEIEDKLNGAESTVEVVPVEEEVVESPEVEVPTVEVSEEVVSFDIDWKWIESLEDTPANKLLLDNYAADNSDVSLKRNMKLPNMVRAYKKALAEK